MNSFVRILVTALASSVCLMLRVKGAAFTSSIVECLPDSMDEVCTGLSFFTTPSPAESCTDPMNPDTCTTELLGGWTWEYNFIEGIEEGTDLLELDPDEVDAAEIGLTVFVSLDDDLTTCSVSINNETCADCSTADCGENEFTYDCTNVDMGGLSAACEPVEPIFYPLLLDGNATVPAVDMTIPPVTTPPTTSGDETETLPPVSSPPVATPTVTFPPTTGDDETMPPASAPAVWNGVAFMAVSLVCSIFFSM
jgi:hypothetical protein